MPHFILICALSFGAGCADDAAAPATADTIDAPDTDATEVAASADIALADVRKSPPAPAELVFARLEGPGSGEAVHVEGILRNKGLLVDRDDADSDDFPFAAVTRSAAGVERFRKTLREPIQIREFIAVAPLPAGFDPFALFPELAAFAVLIPTDPEAATLSFERTERDGSVTSLGTVLLASVPDMPPSPLDDAPVTRLAGPEDAVAALDVVILGDGYTASEMDRFAADALALADAFSGIEPWKSYAPRIAFHRVDTPSDESGAGFDCDAALAIPGCRDALRDTVFRSVFPLRLAVLAGQPVSDRALFQLGQWDVWRAAARVPFDATVVLVNTGKYGAFGLFHASCATGMPAFGLVAAHEFGHSFALLGDEYQVEGDICQRYPLTPDYPNTSPLTSTPAEVPWAAWLTPGVPLPTPDGAEWSAAVGLFRGAGGNCPELYRPQADCFMRTFEAPLCVVCADEAVRRIFRRIDALGSDGVRIVGEALVADVVDGAISGTWELDGAPAGDATAPLALPIPASGEAEHDVVLRVRHATERVRMRPSDLDETVRARVRVTR